MNPLAQAIKSGVKANEMIGDLFARIGSKDHPRGIVTSAYRNARRAMVTALGEQSRVTAARDVMESLRGTIESDARLLFVEAQESGADESKRQLGFYGLSSPDVASVANELSIQNQSALDAVLAVIDAQAAAIIAAIMTSHEDSQIIGDESRQGILRPGEVIQSAGFWATALVWDAFDHWTRNYSGGVNFQKQAIAALDSRTTDCCLRVHAQVQPFNQPFHLTGFPRYADYVDWPGFHWHCRTSGVLYLPQFDDGLSEKMRNGADFFLSERAKGKSPDSSPADAFG
jgi:hypothetical protein